MPKRSVVDRAHGLQMAAGRLPKPTPMPEALRQHLRRDLNPFMDAVEAVEDGESLTPSARKELLFTVSDALDGLVSDVTQAVAAGLRDSVDDVEMALLSGDRARLRDGCETLADVLLWVSEAMAVAHRDEVAAAAASAEEFVRTTTSEALLEARLPRVGHELVELGFAVIGDPYPNTLPAFGSIRSIGLMKPDTAAHDTDEFAAVAAEFRVVCRWLLAVAR